MSLRVSGARTEQKMKLLSDFRETSNQCGKQARAEEQRERPSRKHRTSGQELLKTTANTRKSTRTSAKLL